MSIRKMGTIRRKKFENNVFKRNGKYAILKRGAEICFDHRLLVNDVGVVNSNLQKFV